MSSREGNQGVSEAFRGRKQEEAREGLGLGKPQLCKDPFPNKPTVPGSQCWDMNTSVEPPLSPLGPLQHLSFRHEWLRGQRWDRQGGLGVGRASGEGPRASAVAMLAVKSS